MITIAITGKIATGKSVIMKQFSQLGYNIYSSDTMVRDIYTMDKNVIKLIKDIIPEVVKKDRIDIALLSYEAFKNNKLLSRLEGIVHPKLKILRERIIRNSFLNNKKLILFEIPLLYEKNLSNDFDFVISTWCNKRLQIRRALTRENMDMKKFLSINSKYLGDSLRFKKTDFLINTGIGKNYTLSQIKKIIKRI